MAALVEVLGLLPKLPGHRSGLEVQIIGNEREKGSVAAMEKLESFMNLPKSKQEEIVAKDQEIKAKHEKKEAKRREKGRPEADFQLTGQERCCWSCGNVEQAGRQLCQCILCKGFLCSAPSCCSLHSGFCFGRDGEPECEDDTSHDGAVACVVLPVDQRIKPYPRPLPKSKAAAERALRQILRCESLTPLTPLRAFQHGWSDPLDDGSRISQWLGSILTYGLASSQKHLRCLGSRLVYFADRVDGGETVGNSLGRPPLGGSKMEATTGWTEGKPWEIAWGELRWEGAIRKRWQGGRRGNCGK